MLCVCVCVKCCSDPSAEHALMCGQPCTAPPSLPLASAQGRQRGPLQAFHLHHSHQQTAQPHTTTHCCKCYTHQLTLPHGGYCKSHTNTHPPRGTLAWHKLALLKASHFACSTFLCASDGSWEVLKIVGRNKKVHIWYIGFYYFYFLSTNQSLSRF